MKNILNFLIEVGKLKKIPRTGFVWLGIKNAETIAQHSFRVAIMNWVLGEQIRPKLNLEKLIKISLVHDLCEVYAGDMTPYWGLLPKDSKKRKEILKRWIRLPKKTKEKRDKEKFKKEKKSLENLIKNLGSGFKKEITSYWLDYEKFGSKEGRFVRQGDKIETLLQAKEYWKSDKNSPVFGWWEEVRELVDDPLLLQFLKEIERKNKRKPPLGNILAFLIKVNKLKQMPRTGFLFREVRNPETIAEQSFRTAIMVWALGKRKRINMEKALKMSLCHEICEVYAGDAVPYNHLLPKPREELKKMFLNPVKFPKEERKEIVEYLRGMHKIWPKFPQKEKEKIFQKDYKDENKALQKLTLNLPFALKQEIIGLWDDFKRQLTKEGKFVNQVYWLQTYFQALEYLKENPKFPIRPWREQIAQIITDPVLFDFFQELEEKFLLKRKVIF